MDRLQAPATEPGLAGAPGQAPATARPATPAPRDVLELLKPVTWFPPMWAYMCGVVSSGAPILDRWHLLALGVVLTGPAAEAEAAAEVLREGGAPVAIRAGGTPLRATWASEGE